MSNRPRWNIRRILVIISLAVLIPGAAGLNGQEPFPAWVGLYGGASLDRLDNENRIGNLCKDSETMSTCYYRQLAPAVTVAPLHADPDSGSPRIGKLFVIVVPGRGLSAHFKPADSPLPPVFFTPDLFLRDWGYGMYFHQTIADRRGDWFKLPRGPWDGPAWLHVPAGSVSDPVYQIQAGDIIEMNGSGWYVVGSSRDHLSLRPEQPADAWCGEGDPPPLEDVAPVRFSRTELTNEAGHLTFQPKYLKGC